MYAEYGYHHHPTFLCPRAPQSTVFVQEKAEWLPPCLQSVLWSPVQCTAVAVVSLLIVMIIGDNHLLDYNQVWYPALGKLLWRFNKLEMMSIRAQQLITVTEPDHSLPYRYQMLWWDGMLMKKVFVFCICILLYFSMFLCAKVHQ